MLRKAIAGLVVLGSFSATSVFAEVITAGVKVGTLGVGVELEKQITDSLSGRVGLNYLAYSYDGTEDNVDYEFDAKLETIGALLDWHPFSNGFRITGGVFFNGNEVDATGSPTNGTFEIGDREYSSNAIESLSGTVEFNSFAPYFGIGTSTSFGDDGCFGFTFELGLMYQGEATVDFTAEGPLASNATFKNDLEKEEQDLQDELSNYEWYPVISVGLIYRF